MSGHDDDGVDLCSRGRHRDHCFAWNATVEGSRDGELRRVPKRHVLASAGTQYDVLCKYEELTHEWQTSGLQGANKSPIRTKDVNFIGCRRHPNAGAHGGNGQSVL